LISSMDAFPSWSPTGRVGDCASAASAGNHPAGAFARRIRSVHTQTWAAGCVPFILRPC